MKLSYVILYVKDVKKTLEFYEEAFGLKTKMIHNAGDYAELSTGMTTLAFCNHNLSQTLMKTSFQSDRFNELPFQSQITFSPDDVKEAFQRATQAGAESILEPMVKPWGFEVAIIRDIDGHLIEFAKKVN